MDVEGSDTVLLVKQKVQDKEGIAPANQEFIYAGHRMDNAKTLNDYAVVKEEALQLVDKILGGAEEKKQDDGCAAIAEHVATFEMLAKNPQVCGGACVRARTHVVGCEKLRQWHVLKVPRNVWVWFTSWG